MDTLKVIADGYVHCKSDFYSAIDIISHAEPYVYSFSTGINKMIGEIDSGNWAVSYLLSMYKCRTEDFILLEKPVITLDDFMLSIDEVCELSCYMDCNYNPLFSSNMSLKELVKSGLNYSKLDFSCSDVLEMFQLENHIYSRRLSQTGNARFRAMTAVGFSYGKEIFCFPWLSDKRFNGFHNNMLMLLKMLDDLKKIAIVPVGCK